MKKSAGVFVYELVLALVLGGLIAWFLPPSAMGRIDEMLVTFLSIILAAVIPGVALTAAAARPPAATPKDARRFGDRLSEQVGFWFSFLWLGAVAIGAIVLGRALEWRLPIPRPEFVPSEIPTAGAWLILIAATFSILIAVRSRHVLTAVQSLIAVGTEVHVEQVFDKGKTKQEEVEREIRLASQDTKRGKPTGDRPRH